MAPADHIRGSHFWRTAALASLIIWLALPWLEKWLSRHAGTHGVAPLVAVSVLPSAVACAVFVHSWLAVLAVSGRTSWKLLRKCCVATAFGAGLVWVASLAHPTKPELLDAYCRGVAAAISNEAPPEVIVRDLALVLGGQPGPSRSSTNLGSWARNAFPKHRPTVVVLPLESRSPQAVEALWSVPGGAYGLHYGASPAGMGRLLDYDRHWTNSLWLIVRQE
jgi:hypothetical protein